jgi:hypothetical protein
MLKELAIVAANSLCVAVSGPPNRKAAATAVGAIEAKRFLPTRIQRADASLSPFIAGA